MCIMSVRLTVHEAVVQLSQGGVLFHGDFFEDHPPELGDQLRLRHLQPVQEFINSFLQIVFAPHATNFLHGDGTNELLFWLCLLCDTIPWLPTIEQ